MAIEACKAGLFALLAAVVCGIIAGGYGMSVWHGAAGGFLAVFIGWPIGVLLEAYLGSEFDDGSEG